MKTIGIVLLSTFIFGLICPFIFGEDIDLQALSEKEKKRRKKGEKAKYVITNDNIKTIKLPKKTYSVVIMQNPTEPSKTDNTNKKAVSTKEKDPKQNREYWQSRKKKITADITQLEASIKTDELALNQVFFNYNNMDLPLEKQRLKTELETMTKKLNGAKLRLQNLRKQLDTFADEARKAGVPPGWIR